MANLEALQAQLAEAKQRAASAKSALSEDDIAEQDLRAQIAKANAEARDAEQTKRELDLDRRCEAARSANPDGVYKGVCVQEWEDTFIVERNPKAYSNWLNATTEAAQRRKGYDRTEIGRKYALAVIYDWNGETNDTPQATERLRKFLTENPSLITSITNVAATLAGAFEEERKS